MSLELVKSEVEVPLLDQQDLKRSIVKLYQSLGFSEIRIYLDNNLARYLVK
jgi:hypothetical protein